MTDDVDAWVVYVMSNFDGSSWKLNICTLFLRKKRALWVWVISWKWEWLTLSELQLLNERQQGHSAFSHLPSSWQTAHPWDNMQLWHTLLFEHMPNYKLTRPEPREIHVSEICISMSLNQLVQTPYGKIYTEVATWAMCLNAALDVL